MTRSELIDQIKLKQSFLCVGLDTDLDKIPTFLKDFEDPIFEFNKRIIDATSEYCVAYKPNLAFYESLGTKGWESLEKTIDYIPDNIFKIADAKRGDIGNTSRKYAETFFKYLSFDAVTVAPYMGEDSVTPFLEYPNKWVILLALTSNKGANDFQFLKGSEGSFFESVISKSRNWGTPDNLMFVAGATRGLDLKKVRTLAEEHFLLVPGVGAQGGSLEEVIEYASVKEDIGLLINSSRGIIYAGSGEQFEKEVSAAARKLSHSMSRFC